MSLNKLGDVLVEQGDLPGAKLRYQESLEIRKRLSAADPSSASLPRDVSVSLNNLGDVLVAQGDLAGAKLRYQESLEIRQRLSAADPSSASLQRDLSVSLNKLGDVLVGACWSGGGPGGRRRVRGEPEVAERLANRTPAAPRRSGCWCRRSGMFR